MKPIKVCHIVNLITGRADGVYTHLKSIFRNYDRTKFEHFLIFQGGEKVETELRLLGVEVFLVPSLKNKFSIKSFIDIYKILESTKCDIIHSHLLKPFIIAGLINIFTKKKLIFNYNGLFIHQNVYYGFLEKYLYQILHFVIYLSGSVQVVLVPSKRSKTLLLNETRLLPDPIIYYNGYTKIENKSTNNIVKNELERLQLSRTIIGMVARLEIQKRIDRALDLFCSLRKKLKETHLVVFGDGSLKEDLRKKINCLGLSSDVTFFDYVKNVDSFYPYIDILLSTSDYEGMPLTMWEAMASEVPIVAPDVGGFKEILEGNNCGLIYEPGNLKDAEMKLVQLLGDLQLRKSLGKNGRIAVETKYTEKKFIDQIEKIYLDLVNQ
jgi:glycosyltransferase involved in cell wall biosynthesis